MTKLFPVPDADTPAIQGGRPLFPEGLPLVRPSVPDPEGVAARVRSIMESGVLTNGPVVRELEERAAEYLGVRTCVAVSSCTSGLILLLRAAGLSGDVVLPSFTFAATAHAVAWNGLRPLFTEIDRGTLTLDPVAVAHAIGVRTSAILATHTYGTPCYAESLDAVARESGVRLFFDAAHAFGARHRGVPVGGFGDAEVFSLTPTKPVIAGEGGIIATDDDDLAERCRLGRDYGKDEDYDCTFVGLNARMSEMHAAVALASLEGLDDRIERRTHLVAWYREALEGVRGVSLPTVHGVDQSTYKDFTVLLEPEEFGLEPVEAAKALAAEGIETRRYYAPPVHRMTAYRSLSGGNGELPVTDWAAARVLTLPLWEGMAVEDVELVAEALLRIRSYRP